MLDRTLETVAGQGEKELKRALGDADLLLVRSQELDAAGESGMLNAAWSQFNAVLELLRNLVARLGQAGVRRIVITADHGFVTLSRGLGPNRSIDPPPAVPVISTGEAGSAKALPQRRARSASR